MLDPSISGLMLRIIAGDEVISSKERACSSLTVTLLDAARALVVEF